MLFGSHSFPSCFQIGDQELVKYIIKNVSVVIYIPIDCNILSFGKNFKSIRMRPFDSVCRPYSAEKSNVNPDYVLATYLSLVSSYDLVI